MRLHYILFSLFAYFGTVSFAQQWGDYTLYSVQNSSAAYLCDTNGTNVYSWTFSSTAKTGYSSYLMPGGDLWRTVTISGGSFTGGGMHGRIQKYNYAGTLLWDYTHASTTYNLHHDICPLPNGNVLLISYESKTPSEVTTAGGQQSITVWSEKIIEVQPTGATTGTIVWEWHLWDHLAQNVNASGANYVSSIINNPQLLNINYNLKKDWIHMNGIDYNPMLDQIILSSHNLNEIYVIDHSTTTAEAASHAGGNSGKGGDFLYRWGNPATYGGTGAANFNVLHDAHWIPEGSPYAGYMVGYNNKGISSSQSCFDIFQQPSPTNYNYAHTPGNDFSPSTYFKRIASGGYNSNMGNSQQLPNGNHHICLATAGILKEVDSTGKLLWSKTLSGFTAQSFRYNKCYVNNTAPPIPVISEAGGVLSSTSAVTYQWYLNGILIPGATSQNYTPAQTGIYVVRITDSNGCVYQYSTGYSYTLLTDINEQGDNIYFSVFPNPAADYINILDSYYSNREYNVQIFDSNGKLIFENSNVSQINISGFENGIYFVKIKPINAKSITAKIIVNK